MLDGWLKSGSSSRFYFLVDKLANIQAKAVYYNAVIHCLSSTGGAL
jgi:hypothetical protein